MAEKYLNERQVAEILGRGLSTLRRDRMRGVGIPYVKMGPRHVRYKLSDIEDYMSSHTVKTEDHYCGDCSGLSCGECNG